VSARRLLCLCRQAFLHWDEAIHLVWHDRGANLGSQAMQLATDHAALEAQQDVDDNEQLLERLAMRELMEKVRLKTNEAAQVRKQATSLEAEAAALVAEFESEQLDAEDLSRELWRMRRSSAKRADSGDEALDTLRRQLTEALDVQGSLRYSLRQCEAKAGEVASARNEAKKCLSNVHGKLDETHREFVNAMEVLDRQASALIQEEQEAHKIAQQHQKALDSIIFRVRMCDLELQRWKV